MEISPAIVSTLGAAVAVPLFMALLRRVKPLQHRPDSQKSFSQLAREYACWEWLAVLLSLVLVAVIGFVLWQALDAVYRSQVSNLEAGIFLITLPPILWAVPALFFAIFFSALPFHYLYLALLGRRRYAEYTEYGNQKFGVDSWKLLRYMGNVLLPLCLLMTFMALDCYARVGDQSFVVNRFFGVGEKTYAFDRIERIRLVKSFRAPAGDIRRDPHYAIDFDDGNSFSFHRFPSETSLQRQQQIAVYIAEAIDLEITISDPFQ